MEMGLPPQMKAKEGSSRRKKFVERHGENVYELEAIPPDVLQTLLRNAIDSVIDVDAFNSECDREKEDASFLDGARKIVKKHWKGFLNCKTSKKVVPVPIVPLCIDRRLHTLFDTSVD